MLELNNISVSYGRSVAVNNVTLAFENKSITSLIGPNGSGKTTIMKAAAGLLPVKNGSVLLDNKDISEIDRKELARHISFLPQIKSAGSLTVRALALHGRFPYLPFPRKYSEKDKEITNEALKLAGASDIADRLVNELSGGQQQRAYIAMLLAQQTDIVFLDEPASFLDINARLELNELILKLKELGKTIVLISHDISDALLISDYTAVINKGKLIGYGKSSEIADSGAIEKAFSVKPVYSDEGGIYYFKK